MASRVKTKLDGFEARVWENCLRSSLSQVNGGKLNMILWELIEKWRFCGGWFERWVSRDDLTLNFFHFFLVHASIISRCRGRIHTRCSSLSNHAILLRNFPKLSLKFIPSRDMPLHPTQMNLSNRIKTSNSVYSLDLTTNTDFFPPHRKRKRRKKNFREISLCSEFSSLSIRASFIKSRKPSRLICLLRKVSIALLVSKVEAVIRSEHKPLATVS